MASWIAAYRSTACGKIDIPWVDLDRPKRFPYKYRKVHMAPCFRLAQPDPQLGAIPIERFKSTMPSLGKRIKTLRKARGLTQRALAAEVGINFTYLSKIENDRLEAGQSPRAKTIKTLAEALGADSDELLILGKRIPDSVKQRFFERPRAFQTIASLDDETLDRLLSKLDKGHQRQAESDS